MTIVNKWKWALYAVIGLAAVGVLCLVWYFFGWVVAAVAGAFGIGGASPKALEQFAAAREVELKASERADLDAKEDLAAAAIEADRKRELLHSAAAKDEAATSAKVNGATTRGQLDAVEAIELAKLESLLAPPAIGDPGEDGYIRLGLIALMCLFVLCLLAICGQPVRAHDPAATDAAKARTLRIVSAMRRSRVLIKDLRIQLDAERQSHVIKLKLCHAKRASAAKRHRTQQSILLARKPPPVWPHYVGAYGGATVLCGGILALCIGLRK